MPCQAKDDTYKIPPLPTIVVDTREQCPLVFTHLPAVSDGLTTGDYSILGMEGDFAVERKSLTDLNGSLRGGRDRFMRELQRLSAYRSRALLIVGSRGEMLQLVSQGRANLAQIDHSLLSIRERFGVPAVRVNSPEEGALLIESWAFAFYRSQLAKLKINLPYPEWAKSDFI